MLVVLIDAITMILWTYFIWAQEFIIKVPNVENTIKILLYKRYINIQGNTVFTVQLVPSVYKISL